MSRLAHMLLVLAALALTPLGAAAQTGTTTTTTGAPTQAIQQGLVVKRDGDQLRNDPVIYVTKEHCDSNLEYEFSVRYTAAVPVSELWVGVGTEDCSSTASRERGTTTSTQPVCWLAGNVGSSLNPVIKVRAIDLFASGRRTADIDESDAGVDTSMDAGTDPDAESGVEVPVEVPPVAGSGADGCDEVKDLNYRVFFLPLPQPTNVSGNKAYAPLAAASYGYSTLIATFTLFTQLPDSPTGLEPKTGESEIGVTFNTIAGSLIRTTYRAYFDWGTNDGVACGSGALAGGMPPPDADETIASVTAPSGRGKLTGLDAKGIEIGQLVAASAVTVDPAGNESLLSEPVCVKREETISFIDRCKTDPDCKFETCSLRPGARGRGWLSLCAVLGLAGLALFIRRRHV